MKNEQTIRRESLLHNPAVIRFLSLLEAANHSIVVGGVENKVVSVFAVGSSGENGSRDLDLDIVFESGIGFDAEAMGLRAV